jgi:hypothetical protein
MQRYCNDKEGLCQACGEPASAEPILQEDQNRPAGGTIWGFRGPTFGGLTGFVSHCEEWKCNKNQAKKSKINQKKHLIIGRYCLIMFKL